MTREELTARLAECEGYTFGPWERYGLKVWAGVNYIADTAKDVQGEECKANARLVALAPALASALREAWAEIDRLMSELDERKKLDRIRSEREYRRAFNPSLDAALNSGDGTYKP